MITLRAPIVLTKRYAVFNPTNGDLISVTNKEPVDGSYIPVEEKDVTSIVNGTEPMSYYYVHYNKSKKTYELRSRNNFDIDSYFVNDLIYEVKEEQVTSADIRITKNVKDTCWKFSIGGDLKANILAQKVSFKQIMFFSITKKNDPNILYKTISFNFEDLVDGKYIVLPFDSKFEFNNEPISIYTIKRFDKYMYEVIK